MPHGGFLGAHPDRPLFGRHAERARLVDALDAVQNGHARVVALAGEPGVGKTRLAQEASLLADERGYLVLVGRCYEERASLPLYPFVDALAAGLALAPDSLRRQVPRRWPDLGTLLSRRSGGTPASPLGQSEDARLHLFAAVSEFMRELAVTTPVVLLLDDVHWADSASLGLLVYLARDLAAHPVLLLMTYRDMEVGGHPALRAAVRDLTRERLLDTLSIRGLELEDTAEMVRAHLHQESVPDAFVSLIHGRTVGNAFFIEEVLRALAEQRRPSASTSTWSTDTGARTVPLPDTVRAVVEQRVERLDTSARETLRLASVFGQQFDLPVLLSAANAPDEAVLSDLQDAVDAQLIQEQQPSHGGRYGFVHALVQQTLYEQQPLQRRGLHARVARAIERVRGRRVDAAAELAWHFLASGDTERATRYSIVAGDHSASLYAHAEAAEHYQRALELLLDDDDDEQQLATLRCKLGAELNYISRREEALAAYERALLAFERSRDTDGQARAHHGMAAVEHGRWDFPAELPHLEAALRLTPDDATAERAWLLLDAVRVRCIVADYAAAVPLAARALSIVEQLDDLRLQARALTESAHVEMYHSPATALELLARAEPLARQAGDWRTLGRIHWSAGHRWQEAGDWQRSRSAHQAAMAAFERAGEPERVVFCLRLQASECLQLGAWEDGRIAARRAAEMDPEWQFHSLPGPAFLAWMEGQPEQALEDLRTYIAISRQRNDFQSLPTGLYMLADCALQLDQVGVALSAASEAFELVREHGFWPYAVLVGAPLAEALVRSKVENVEHQLEAIQALVDEHDQRGGDAQFLRARGVLQRQRGDLQSAIQALQQSAAVAREQSAVIQCGRTLAVLAEVAAATGDGDLASSAAADLVDVTRQIGPEVATLAWATPVLAKAAPSRRERYPDGLTQREVEVLRLVSAGHSNLEIAEELVMSVRTVERHITNLYAKLGARNRADATAYAMRHHLV
jgi:DNA-binding NarL/FixJ family response regulator